MAPRTRLDLEVDFISSQGGVWRSRALGFRGKFSCRMKAGYWL